MRMTVLVVAGILSAGQALAQSQREGAYYPSDETFPPNTVMEGSEGVREQQAALPEQQATDKHPGTLSKLRGGYMDSPTVEGDATPDNFLGLPEPKKSKEFD